MLLLSVECVESARWPNSPRRSCGSALDLRFSVGEVRQDRVDRNVNEVVEVGKGLDVTVKEPQEQRRVKHENREGEMTER